MKNQLAFGRFFFWLNLKQAGGNYYQIKKYLKLYKINTKHFTGRAWNKGITGFRNPRILLYEMLVINREYQSFKLKKDYLFQD
ncbi:MAG: hypothetical protein P1P85_02360 [Patescibacteria group bacterium]|nr:hypothetical protein [Patescibacteria group bacterium]